MSHPGSESSHSTRRQFDESELQPSDPSHKPCRKGRHSVANLSQEQRERKRKNDRDAQRLNRQRNKEAVAELRQQVDELRNSGSAKDLEVAQLQARIRELKEQNDYLRSRVGEDLSERELLLALPDDGMSFRMALNIH